MRLPKGVGSTMLVASRHTPPSDGVRATVVTVVLVLSACTAPPASTPEASPAPTEVASTARPTLASPSAAEVEPDFTLIQLPDRGGLVVAGDT